MSYFEQRENLADDIDKAAALGQQHLDEALLIARRQAEQSRKPDAEGNFDDTTCEECGVDIPLARMRVASKNHLCIHCAEAGEAISRTHRR